MKIGLVQYLNARPLDYGIRLQAQSDKSLILSENVPSNLANDLLTGDLDIALISSIEYLRNKETLNIIPNIGVCTKNKADSLFYIRSKTCKPKPATPVHTIYADQGSRSTIALLKLLYKRHNNSLPQIISCNPKAIPELVKENMAGLLIGDAAIKFRASKSAQNYWIEDLASWWYREENLPFVFALWAYPKHLKLNHKLFLDSLALGLDNIPEIANDFPDFPEAQKYLSEVLHYNLGIDEKKSLQRFAELSAKYKTI